MASQHLHLPPSQPPHPVVPLPVHCHSITNTTATPTPPLLTPPTEPVLEIVEYLPLGNHFYSISLAAISTAYSSPLHCATRRRTAACVGVLLRAGANPDIVKFTGYTALNYAVCDELQGVGRALIAGEGAAGRLEDKWVDDPMLYAVRVRPEMVAVLAEAGWVGARVERDGARGEAGDGADWEGVAGGGGRRGGAGRGCRVTHWAPLQECVWEEGWGGRRWRTSCLRRGRSLVFWARCARMGRHGRFREGGQRADVAAAGKGAGQWGSGDEAGDMFGKGVRGAVYTAYCIVVEWE